MTTTTWECTTTPDRIRITCDLTEDMPWQVDAYDSTTATHVPRHMRSVIGEGANYTERCWNFKTFAEAHAAVPEFIAALASEGIDTTRFATPKEN
jgi:hypothetical protein